jgi:YVTN family beta-propeller protein
MMIAPVAGFLALMLAAAAQAAPFAYVANEKSGTLSVIDTATDVVVGEIKAGTKPRGMAAASGSTRIFVSDQPANALLVVDAGSARWSRRSTSASRRKGCTSRRTAS